MTMDMHELTGTWDYSTLPENVRLGDGCFLERKDSFMRYRSKQNPGVELGRDVQVYTWTQFNIDPSGAVDVGDGSILVGAVFMCSERISIGRRVVVSYHVTIADSDFHPLNLKERRLDAMAIAPGGDLSFRPPVESAPVRIDDDVHIGIGTIILKGVHIGAGAVVAAGSVVTRDIPAGARAAGNPARVIQDGEPL
jgi:acetyltransferase-like isoleucine patch superfamily enzyme